MKETPLLIIAKTVYFNCSEETDCAEGRLSAFGFTELIAQGKLPIRIIKSNICHEINMFKITVQILIQMRNSEV